MQLILHTIDERLTERGINKEDDAANKKSKHEGGDVHVDTIDKSLGTKSDIDEENDGVVHWSRDGDNRTDVDRSTNTSETRSNIKSSDAHFDKSRETDVKTGMGNGEEVDLDMKNDGSSNCSNDAEISSSKENSSCSVEKKNTSSDSGTDMCIDTTSDLNEDGTCIDAERDETRKDADINMSSNLEINKGIYNNNSNTDSLKNIDRHQKEADLNERREAVVDVSVSKSLGINWGKNTYTDGIDGIGTIDDNTNGTGVNDTKINKGRNNTAALAMETQSPDESSQVKGKTPPPKTEEVDNTTKAKNVEKITRSRVNKCQQSLMSNNQLQRPGLNLESLLPHEGQRWAMLRDKMMMTAQFEQYVKRTRGESPWSADEAFISFFLDR